MAEAVLHRIVVKSELAARKIPYRLSGRQGVSNFDIVSDVHSGEEYWLVTFNGPADLDLDVLRPDIIPPKTP